MKKTKPIDRIKKRLRSIEVNEKFQERIREIRRYFNIPLGGCKTLEEVNKRISDATFKRGQIILSMNDKFDYSDETWLEKILKEFEISDFYREFIEDYVYYNNFYVNSIRIEKIEKEAKLNFFFDKPDDNFYISDEEEKTKRFSKIIIEVNPETILDDIKAIWPKIREMQEELIGYKKRYKYSSLGNTEIDRRIYDLYLEGIESKEIAKTIKKEFSIDRLTYSDVNKRVSNFKKKCQL